MLLHRKIVLAVLILVTLAGSLSACGFKPIYKQDTGEESASMREGLASIYIKPIGGRMGQLLKGNIANLTDPQNKQSNHKYDLTITMKKELIPLAIQQDREVTRYNLVIKANYNLTERGSGKHIDSGNIKVVGGFDAVDSQFAAYVAEKDSTNRVLKEMAQEFKLRLTAALLNRNP